MKADISGFLQYLDGGAQDLKKQHMIVTLIGSLKGEPGKRYQIMVMVRATMSGVMAGRWAGRLGRSLVTKRQRNGILYKGESGED